MKKRNMIAQQMILRTGNHSGKHHNRQYDVRKGKSRKNKHKKTQREVISTGSFSSSLI